MRFLQARGIHRDPAGWLGDRVLCGPMSLGGDGPPLPCRMVFLVDELEQRGLVERRRNAADRRSYALYLTARGRDTLRQIQAAGSRHQDELGASLTQAERIQLAGLLRRLATEQGITEDNLPGIPPRPPLASAQPRTDRPAGGPGPAG